MTRLTTCADAEAVAERAAADIAREVERTREQRGLAHLALSGGSTPRRTYELLSFEPAQLEGAEIWFADERCVPPEHEQSNYRLVAETVLGPAGIAPKLVHRMEGELGPEEGARRYAQELREGLESGPLQLPVFDLIVLGIGPDGHVASLFPASPALDAGDDVLCLGVRDSPKPPPERITLSLAVLRAARRCLLLATGASKADAIDATLGEPSRRVPASLLRRERLTVIVDDAAAPRGPRP
ncbi:MAG TPA: 6-phosphogluconolactonase [Solirubrobacteraceae bacterium]|jgi:6-phosphogluconolactonase|nr:6-phosphogluconolactonase [Solirubrobacteraceae bacterium]